MKFSTTALAAGLAGLVLTCSMPAAATVVLVKTSLGNFEVNLFDQTTPLSVANFLTYVNKGSYNNTLVHRTLPGFVMQGGGFTYSGNNTAPFTATAVLAPVKNEPLYSNLRGTIAMAKLLFLKHLKIWRVGERKSSMPEQILSAVAAEQLQIIFVRSTIL